MAVDGFPNTREMYRKIARESVQRNEERRNVEPMKLCMIQPSLFEGLINISATRFEMETIKSAMLIQRIICRDGERISLYKAYVRIIRRHPSVEKIVETRRTYLAPYFNAKSL